MSDTTLLDELLRHKLGIIDRKLEELEAVSEGERKLISIAMAYIKRLESENVKLKEAIDSLTDAMVEHRNDIDAVADRCETSSVWATRMNKWAKEQGMT